MRLYNPNKNLELLQIKVYVFTNMYTFVISVKQAISGNELRVLRLLWLFSRAFSQMRRSVQFSNLDVPGTPQDLAP